MITLFLILFCLSSPAYADNLATHIAAIEKAYQSFADLSAHFTQETYVAILQKTITRKGTFHFKKGGKLRIEYGKPDAKYYISDGTTLWTYVPGDEESLTTLTLSDDVIPREALSFLGGFGKLKKEFSVSPSNAFASIPTNHTALHLIPRSKKAQYESLDALFNSAHELVDLKIENITGNVTTYHFANIRTNTSLKDELFMYGP